MRVFQVSPDGLASLFDAHHAKEAAEHAAASNEAQSQCSCGNCPTDEEIQQEFEKLQALWNEKAQPEHGSLDDFLLSLLMQGGPAGDEEEEIDDFDPSFAFGPQFGPPLLSREQQIDMLGHMIIGLIGLVGLFAQLTQAEGIDEAA